MMSMRPVVKTVSAFGNGLLDLILPPRCLVCGVLDRPVLCNDCQQGFVPVRQPFCDRCGNPHQAPCSTCKHRSGADWHFDRARGADIYDGTLALAIQKLKYNRQELLADPLGEHLAGRLRNEDVYDAAQLSAIGAVVPVPLHTSRLRQRGFNQAELLARPVSLSLGVPVLPRALRRAIATRQQVHLSGEERRQNMHPGVFVVNNVPAVAGKGILLIDDVMTTAATLDAAAAALKAAGADPVLALTLAVGA